MKQHVWNFLTACIQTTPNLFPGKPVGGKLWGFRKPKFFECQEMLHSKEIDATKILLHKNALNGNHLNLSFYLSIKRVETLLVSNCCQDVDILACVITQIFNSNKYPLIRGVFVKTTKCILITVNINLRRIYFIFATIFLTKLL